MASLADLILAPSARLLDSVIVHLTATPMRLACEDIVVMQANNAFIEAIGRNINRSFAEEQIVARLIYRMLLSKDRRGTVAMA